MLAALDGDKEKLVIDLSCRRVGQGWRVAMDRWQTITEFEINQGTHFFFTLRGEGQDAGSTVGLVTRQG